jgi:hypothetical protein
VRNNHHKQNICGAKHDIYGKHIFRFVPNHGRDQEAQEQGFEENYASG